MASFTSFFSVISHYQPIGHLRMPQFLHRFFNDNLILPATLFKIFLRTVEPTKNNRHNNGSTDTY
jgi:hypothetical protein